MNGKRNLQAAMLLVGAVGAMVALHRIELPVNTYLWQAIGNASHVPLFGLLALAVLGISVRVLGSALPNPYLHYVVAVATIVLLAALSEYLQISSSRDADVMDFVRDVLGGVSTLGLYVTLDRAMDKSWAKARRYTKTTVRVGSLLIAIVAFASMLSWVIAYSYRGQIFPSICSFESSFETRFLMTPGANLKLVPAPDGWAEATGQQVGRLTLQPVRHAGLTINEPYPDWSAYSFLCFDIYSENRDLVTLVLRVDDVSHNGHYNDRFNEGIVVRPGLNRYRIPLREVRAAPVGRKMDMNHVVAIVLFAMDLTEARSIYVDDIRLE